MRRTRSGLCDESGVGLRRAFLFLLAVVLDVTTKAAARSLLAGAAVPLPFGARLSLHLNPGVAFGMAGAWGGLLGLGGIGILLFLTALDMLFERRTKRREGTAGEEEHDDPAVFPLATPLIAGPGSLATMVLLAGQPGIGWSGTATLILIMLAVIALCYLACAVSGHIARALGRTGIVVVTRLLGMLLAALSVQFVIDGIRHSLAAG